MKPWLGRPVVARLLEPAAWTSALLVVLSGPFDGDARQLAMLCFVYAAARLVTDTAPNLIVGPRLEAEPYAEHMTRKSLARVKLTLGLVSMLIAFALTRVLGNDLGLSALAWLVGLPIVLASHAVALPVVREHRGVPVARPNIGPATGAIVFLACALLARGGLFRSIGFDPVLVASLSIVISNVVAGAVQRVMAAARKINRPGYSFFFADVGALDRNPGGEDDRIAERAAVVVPFLLLPLLPAAIDLFVAPTTRPPIAVLAAFAAALPPLLFDAKRRARRFRFAAYGVALALTIAALLIGVDVAHRPLLDTAALLLAYPALNALVDLGARRSLATLLTVYLLGKAVTWVWLATQPWPFAETLFTLLAMAAALEQDSKRSP